MSSVNFQQKRFEINHIYYRIFLIDFILSDEARPS